MRFRFVVSCLLLLILPRANAVDFPESSLSDGDLAPPFQAATVSGQVWRSEEYIGKKLIVVYFYPADFTSGCTRQACCYRDHKAELEAAGVEVVGVSGDSVATHELFTRANSLNFSLLADEDGRVARAFGVPVREGDTITRVVDGVEQTLRRGVTASRWTFIIGRDGRIVRRNTTVDADMDCRNVLETVRRMAAVTE